MVLMYLLTGLQQQYIYILNICKRDRQQAKTRHHCKLLKRCGGARGVMVIVVGNGHGDTSSNPGRDWLHFT